MSRKFAGGARVPRRTGPRRHGCRLQGAPDQATRQVMYRPDDSPPRWARVRLDWRSACLFMAVDPSWRRKVWIAGLVLLIPVIGWPAILGFRKEAIFRLVHGNHPVLPD